MFIVKVIFYWELWKQKRVFGSYAVYIKSYRSYKLVREQADWTNQESAGGPEERK